ncbi:hypothetical protein ACQPW3_36435 [Actinosynnema sp. CA-248983]
MSDTRRALEGYGSQQLHAHSGHRREHFAPSAFAALRSLLYELDSIEGAARVVRNANLPTPGSIPDYALRVVERLRAAITRELAKNR